jgi:hypothetical protein
VFPQPRDVREQFRELPLDVAVPLLQNLRLFSPAGQLEFLLVDSRFRFAKQQTSLCQRHVSRFEVCGKLRRRGTGPDSTEAQYLATAVLLAETLSISVSISGRRVATPAEMVSSFLTISYAKVDVYVQVQVHVLAQARLQLQANEQLRVHVQQTLYLAAHLPSSLPLAFA